MITDLTEGNIHKKLWLFSIPMLISVAFQQIYNIADSMIAGRFAGESALAAVGASYPITMLFIAVAMGCNIGCSVIISQLFGAKDIASLKTAVYTTYLSCAALSVILTILGFLTSTPLLNLIHTPQDIFADSRLYLNIYIGGLIFLFLYNVCTGIFNALGDSRTPLFFLIGSSVANILLDLWFVISFQMGVAGVAWATFLAQGVSAILSLFTLMKRLQKMNTLDPVSLFSISMLGKISNVAIPSILQQSFISIGNMFIQSLVNGFGSGVIAGYSAAIKLNTFAITSFTTLANGLSTFTAQNIGAGKTERVKKGFLSGMLLALFIVLPFFCTYFFANTQMMLLFLTDSGTTALQTGKEFLILVSPFYFVVCTKLMADSILRGSGAMRYFMITTFTDLVLRVLLAFLLAPRFGARGIWMSWPIGWSTAALLSLIFYFSGVWRKSVS
ncbi:MAG: MATE family efflux transporter [Clostridiales bacterium]|nr:MATE family efflux transporter [Clostridiales bacterium]